MKKLILVITILAINFSKAQVLEPVKWETSVSKVSDNEAVLIATATIDSGWHLYSQAVPDDGPIPTSFTFEGNGKYLKKGNTVEEEGHTIDDPIFGMKIKYFENKATFKQTVRLKSKNDFIINGIVTFMVCDDKRCLAPTEEDLEFNIE
jgi:thiol:disulfide interchange protein DsbD